MALELEMRYYIEHRALPQALYECRAQLMASLLGKKNRAMMDFYAKAEKANPTYKTPYTAQQFSVSFREYVNAPDAVFVMRIGMPEPEQSPLCRAVYLCFGGESCEDAYFTSELAPEGQYLLCAWSADGIHLNFGEEDKEDFDRVAELYWEIIQNGRSTKYKSLRGSERKLSQ